MEQTDVTSWSNVIADNAEKDPIKTLLERVPTKDNITSTVTRKGRGRPPKRQPSTDESIDATSTLDPIKSVDVASTPAPETLVPTKDLIDMFSTQKSRSRSSSPSKSRKSVLKFSTDLNKADEPDEPDSNHDIDPERVTLLKMYKQYFRKPLIDKHKRKEKLWTEKSLNSEIYREIRELEACCSEDDPASFLATGWVHFMSGIEATGPMYGLRTQRLSEFSAAAAEEESFKSNMREILLKYPYLRKLVGLGGYPELKLLVVTATMIRQVHDFNTELMLAGQQGASKAPVPEHLKKTFHNL